MFNKIRRFLNKKCVIMVYKSMLLPFYDYCDIIFMYLGQNELQNLNRQHVRGIQICLNNGFLFDEAELYVKCNLSELDIRRQVHVRDFMFKLNPAPASPALHYQGTHSIKGARCGTQFLSVGSKGLPNTNLTFTISCLLRTKRQSVSGPPD